MVLPYPTMDDGYNMTVGLSEFTRYINVVTEGWISNLILFAVYCILMFVFYKASDDFAGAFAVSGFVTFIISLLFWLGGFVTGITLAVTIAFAIIGVLVLMISRN